MKLILASASPRRKELLSYLKIPFDVRAADIDESLLANEVPSDFVKRLSFEKATKVRASENECVIGSDTVVAIDNLVLGKPADDKDAERMLRSLSGNWHDVFTGVSILFGAKQDTFSIKTSVLFDVMSEKDILDYIATGEPKDKAGAYAIQGIGGKFVKEIRGSYSNVIGLPLNELKNVLENLTFD